MVSLCVDTHPLGFPGSGEEQPYLQDRLQHGYDLVAVLAAGLTFLYYWKVYDGSTTPRVDRSPDGT